MSERAQRGMGQVSIIIGIIVMGLTLYLLFVPSSYLPLPAIMLGVTSIISVVALLVAFSIKS